jgi:GeoRSP system SPASM domain protein
MKNSFNKTLSAPLRVYWDLTDAPDATSRELALKVARELSSLRVFFVILKLDGRRDDIGEVLGVLKSGGVRVTVSISGADSLPGPGALAYADAVDLRPADTPGQQRLLETVKKDVPAGKPMSVSVVPSKDNIGPVMEIISAAVDAGIKNISLINPCLIYDRGRAREYVIGQAERDVFKSGLEKLLTPLGPGIKLFVHDLFLHKSLNLPGLPGRIEYAGCQAGDAIAYIDSAFTVYPCATMPVPLGSLHETTLKDIWSGAGRKTLRQKVEELPEQCAGCQDASYCKGGCRGLAWEVGGEGCIDPNCGKYTGLV